MTTGRSSNTSRAFWEMKAEQVMDRVFIPTMGAVTAEPALPLSAPASPAADPLDDSIEVEVREAPSSLPVGMPVGVAGLTNGAAAAPAAMPQPIPSGTGFAVASAPAEPITSQSGAGSTSAGAAAPAAPGAGTGVWRRSPWGRMSWQPRRPAFSSAWLSQPWQIAGVSVSPRLALAFSGGVACLALGTSATLWFGWNQANSDLRQERTIRLLEGIRKLGPREEADATASRGATTAAEDGKDNADKSADGLPPPPPDEPWIEELGQLDGQRSAPRSNGAAPLRVPVNGTLRAPAPVASAPASLPVAPPPPVPAAAAAPSPELVGVVQIPGRPGSAIFQVGGSSTNASAGENIGSSGWRLVTTNGDSAVIERGGVSRRVSISSGF